MTDLTALVEAIREDPEDDDLRLVFADWLEEHGWEDRAAWVRASCDLARLDREAPDDHAASARLRQAVWTAFERCRPEWWEDLPGIFQQNHRGLFCLTLRSKTAATRLGKSAWLGRALAEGWVDRITIAWSDDLLARAVAAWKGPVRQVPLFVHPAPQIGEEGLAYYLGLPTLRGLDLPWYARRNPCVGHLGDCAGLRELRLEGVSLEEEEPTGVLDQVGRLTGLRRLRMQGRDRPTDADMARLNRLTELRTLELWDNQGLTDAGLAQLIGLPKLREVVLLACPRVTPQGVEALRAALPSARIEKWG